MSLKNEPEWKISLWWHSVINDLRVPSVDISGQFTGVALSLKTLHSKVKQ